MRPYKGKHPAEKPLALLEHAINATTYPGDIVLDCFSGSGSTAFTALKLGRLAVAMEIDRTWIARTAAQLEVKAEIIHEQRLTPRSARVQKLNGPQRTLF